MTTATPFIAAAINVALVAMFGLQHSIMARPGFKRVWTKIVPETIERSTFCLFAAAALGLLLVAAENSGGLAGSAKDFLDRCFYPAQPLQLNLPYGLVISAGNDGRNAQAQLQRILSGIPFKPVAEPLIFRGEPGEDARTQCRELGQGLAEGLAMGIY